MELVVFEPDNRDNFSPLSLTRPTFDFLHGSVSLLKRTESQLGMSASYLIVPDYLKALTRETHPEARVNEEITRPSLAVNSLVSSRFNLIKAIKNAISNTRKNVMVFDSSGTLVFAAMEELNREHLTEPARFETMCDKEVIDEREMKPLIKYPWDLVSENSQAIEKDFLQFDERDKQNRYGDLEVLGNKIHISSTAQVGRFVTLDSRNGAIIIDDDSEVQSFSHLTGPCSVGKKSLIKSARIGPGSSVGSTCKVSGELDESVVSDFANKSHEGYLGHSFVGSWVNLGAMTTDSDLKNTYGEIKVIVNGKRTTTGLNKVGCFFGDMSKTAIGTFIYTGKSIGVASQILGIVAKDVPSFTLYNGSNPEASREIYFESAVDTQRRMMARRNAKLTENYALMMKSVFDLTANERASHGVKLGKFEVN